MAVEGSRDELSDSKIEHPTVRSDSASRVGAQPHYPRLQRMECVRGKDCLKRGHSGYSVK